MHLGKVVSWLCCLCLTTACQPGGAGEEAAQAVSDTLPLSIKDGDELALWGADAAPSANSTTDALVEEVLSDSGTKSDPQRTIDHIKTPTITAYLPSSPNGACSPGTAGYQKLPFMPQATQELYDKYVTDLKVKANAALMPPELPAPAFIVMAHDDNKVDPENALRFYDALKLVGVSASAVPPLPKVSAELHIFAAGSHGFAIRNAKGPIAMWTTLATNWMGALGIIPEVESISCHY